MSTAKSNTRKSATAPRNSGGAIVDFTKDDGVADPTARTKTPSDTDSDTPDYSKEGDGDDDPSPPTPPRKANASTRAPSIGAPKEKGAPAPAKAEQDDATETRPPPTTKRPSSVVRAADLAKPAPAAPTSKTSSSAVRASDLVKEAQSDSLTLASHRFDVGDKVMARPISDALVPVLVHWFSVGAGDDRTTRLLQCTGAGCVLCATGNEAKSYFLVAMYFILDGAVETISFAKAGGPGTLFTQLVKILSREDCTDLLIEIERKNRSRYVVRVVKQIEDDGAAYGDDVLADIAARGGISEDDVLATVDQMCNEELLEEYPSLRTVLTAKGKL